MNATEEIQSSAAGGDANAMPLYAESAMKLASTLGQFNLLGEGDINIPWGTNPSVAAFKDAIAKGEAILPWAYQSAYVRALHDNMERLFAATAAASSGDPAETLLGAIYQHEVGSPVGPQLRRFNVVISHFFRAFLANHKRQRLGLKSVERLPPLATFNHTGARGPYTFPADAVTNLVGSNVGIVSLPSTYSDHPVIWAALSHETCGHDIVHAVPGLLAELSALPLTLVPTLVAALGVDAGTAQALGILWRYWIDEAAADVCATLNMGPSFALNFTALLAAFHGEIGPPPAPALWTSAIAPAGEPLDSHPVDILRLGLAIGAVGSLHSLNVATRQYYVALLSQIAATSGAGAATVTVQGEIPLPGSSSIPLNLTLPVATMQYAASIMGAAIANTPLSSLNGYTLQQVETWDTFDEQAAWRFALAVKNNAETLPAVYSAHVFAGATLALYNDPDRYSDVTGRVAEALDEQVQRDRYWSVAQRTRAYTMPVVPPVPDAAAAPAD
jgi:hypothetical protein